MNLAFYAPKQWWENKEKAIKEDCNGCGSELDISARLVPDTLYGLNIIEKCCCPHDYMYKHGLTLIDKVFADCMFLYNMVVLILNTGGILTIPRLLRATKYFIAVAKFGDKSFSVGKNVSNEKVITFTGETR